MTSACADCGLPYDDPGFADLVITHNVFRETRGTTFTLTISRPRSADVECLGPTPSGSGPPRRRQPLAPRRP